MKLYIKSKLVLRFLLTVIFFLLVGNIIVNFLKFSDASKKRIVEIIISFFDFDLEQNLPTFYSSFSLLAASFLLALIAVALHKRREKRSHWLGLSFIFGFLAMDEFIGIHEYLWQPTKDLLNTSGLLFAAWYIPYGIILFFLLFVYVKWFILLPKHTRYFFAASGLIFVSGAVGLEAISGYYHELLGSEALTGFHHKFKGKNYYLYCFYYTLEELFEMCGIALFIYSLLHYISEKLEFVNIKISK